MTGTFAASELPRADVLAALDSHGDMIERYLDQLAGAPLGDVLVELDRDVADLVALRTGPDDHEIRHRLERVAMLRTRVTDLQTRN